MTQDEIDEIEKDTIYIKSIIILPEMKSYEERNWKLFSIVDGMTMWDIMEYLGNREGSFWCFNVIDRKF